MFAKSIPETWQPLLPLHQCAPLLFNLFFFLFRLNPSKFQNHFSGQHCPWNICEELEATWRKESKSKVRFISSNMSNKVQPMQALCASRGDYQNSGRGRERVLSHSVEVYVPEQHFFTLGNLCLPSLLVSSLELLYQL